MTFPPEESRAAPDPRLEIEVLIGSSQDRLLAGQTRLLLAERDRLASELEAVRADHEHTTERLRVRRSELKTLRELVEQAVAACGRLRPWTQTSSGDHYLVHDWQPRARTALRRTDTDG